MLTLDRLRGVPAGVGVAYGYRSSNGEGAILTTKGLVKHNVASATTVQVMSTWFRQNYAKLLEQNPRAKRRGLWVITSTYTVPRCRIALLKSKDAEVHLSAEASVSDALNAKVAASWWHHQAGGLWKNHAAVSNPLSLTVMPASSDSMCEGQRNRGSLRRHLWA